MAINYGESEVPPQVRGGETLQERPNNE